MKFDAGFVKIPRRWWTLLESAPPAWVKVWIYVALHANIRPGMFHGRLIQPGQLARSVATIAKDCGVSPRQTRGALDGMRTTSVAAIETTNQYSLITVLDWPTYSGSLDSECQTERQGQGHGSGQTNDKRDGNDIENKELRIKNSVVLEEEESAREADSPPLLLPDEPPSGKTSPMEVRAFLATKIGRFHEKYPIPGGKLLTIEKAMLAYADDPTSGPVEAWWAEVEASLEVFLDLYRRGRFQRIPDPPFWFEDNWHRTYRPAPAPPPRNQPEEPADASPPIELQQTERTIALVPSPHGLRSAPRPCGRCKGLGDLPGPVPPLDLAMTPEEIAMLTESARIPCPQCHPAMAATA